jgi:DNA segregation ATPase FtsK/SpoIIIE-like protein
MRAGQKHYKVGVTKDLVKRVAGIQTSNPNKIELVSSRLVDTPFGIENELHKKLEELASGGGSEWFEMQPKQVIELCIFINTYRHIELSERVVIKELLDRQLVWKKSVEKKLDIVLNNYQKAVVRTLNDNQRPIRSTDIDIPNPTAVSIRPSAEEQDNELYKDAKRVVLDEGAASTSMLQRRLRIGYGRAARMIELLEEERIVGPADGSRRRSVLIPVTTITD